MLRPVTTRSRSRGTSAPPAGGTPLADLALVPALAGARLVPPGASLDRPVLAVVLLDADAPEEPGALIVCPGSPPDVLPAGCAAVVCRTAPVAPLDVPVLVLAPGAAWGAVMPCSMPCIANSTIRIAFFADRPISTIRPIWK